MAPTRPPYATQGAAPSRLRRSLGLTDLSAIGLNATVGSGIFLLPDDLYRAMGPLSPLAFALCAVGLLPIAWCFADSARRTNRTGGPYVYARDAFGDQIGFSVGWMCFANAVFSFAAVAAAAAAYAGRLLPGLEGGLRFRLFAVAIIVAFGILNYLGARPGAWAIRLFTFGKFAVLLLLTGALLPEGGSERLVAPAAPALSVQGVGSAVFMALFALQGFEVVPVPAGEARTPERKVPLAVLLTVLGAAALYVVIQAVLVLGFPGLAVPSDAPLADAAVSFSPSLGVVVAAGALVSTLGFVSGSALGTPRYLFAMAQHGSLPVGLSALHPRFLSPHVAVASTCAVAAVLVVPFDYRALIGMSNVAVAVQYGATCAAVLRVGIGRAEQPLAKRRVGLSLAGLVCTSAILFAATQEEILTSLVALMVGQAIHALTRRGRPRT